MAKSIIVLLAATVPTTLAWGVVGHEAIATVAQIHLHDSARAAVAAILPPYTKGHLAPTAAWADRVRMQMRWSGVLHYITPNGDHPNDTCVFDQGFKDEEQNVVQAIANYTQRVADYGEDFDLRFLTHYVGDVHQPLHLTGRERGGNGDPIYFDHRKMSLHGLWDTQLLARAVRELHNYTSPTNSRQIESNLRHTVYDNFIRWIVIEGLGHWWQSDIPSWLECPANASTRIKVARRGMRFGAKARSSVFNSKQIPLSATTEEDGGDEDDILICPEHWAAETHRLATCVYPFPDGYDPSNAPPELGGSAYYGRVRRDKIVESLLVKGGLRLAAVLNGIFADEDELASKGLVDLTWMREGASMGKETWWGAAEAGVKRSFDTLFNTLERE